MIIPLWEVNLIYDKYLRSNEGLFFFFFVINNLLHGAWWQSMPTRDYLWCINPNLTYAVS